MPPLKRGTYVNKCNDGSRRYIRVSAGPQRDKYVHDLIMEAKLGRPLAKHETVEHRDGNGLNNDPANLELMTRPENTRAMLKRRNGDA